MINKREKELLIEMMTNIDEVIKFLTDEEKKYLRRSIDKINGNYHNILEGIPDGC